MLKAHFFTQVLAKHNIYLGDSGGGWGGGHRCVWSNNNDTKMNRLDNKRKSTHVRVICEVRRT
jgi:hypothetical protein